MCKSCESRFDKQIANGKILVQKIKARVVKYQSGATIDGEFYVDLKQTISNFVNLCLKGNASSYSLRTVGYYVATIRDGKIVARASFCTPDDYKKFCPSFGKTHACVKLFSDEEYDDECVSTLQNQETKLINGNGVCYILPYTLKDTREYFKKRCLRYFKGMTFESVKEEK